MELSALDQRIKEQQERLAKRDPHDLPSEITNSTIVASTVQVDLAKMYDMAQKGQNPVGLLNTELQAIAKKIMDQYTRYASMMNVI